MMEFYIGQNNGRRYEGQLEALSLDFKNKRVVLALSCYEIDAEGKKIQSEISREYQRMLIADNATGVDPVSGDYVEPLTPDATGIFPEDAVHLCDKFYPAGAIGEYNFFNHIWQNVPVINEKLALSVLSKNRHRLMPDGLIPEPEEA